MAYSEQQIVNDVVAHANQEGSGFRNWYAGIASDPQQRLFTDHGVPQGTGWWIHREATSSAAARRAEQALLAAGFDGGPGGGDETTRHVYAYRKVAGVTNP